MAKVSSCIDEKGIAFLTISNPPLNALDEETMLQLEACLQRIATDDQVHVVVITGEGTTFVVGADVNRVNAVNTAAKGIELTSRAHQILNAIEASRKPVIAAINGLCLGGGTELALACHMRIAAEQAQMALPEIRLGIMPGFGGTQRMARLLGTARALEIMLTARFIDMQEAARIGLVSRVVPEAELIPEVTKLAKGIATQGQLAVRAIVEAIIDGVKLPLEEGLRLESRLFGRLVESEDKQEGLRAFLEKRKPVFKGR